MTGFAAAVALVVLAVGCGSDSRLAGRDERAGAPREAADRGEVSGAADEQTRAAHDSEATGPAACPPVDVPRADFLDFCYAGAELPPERYDEVLASLLGHGSHCYSDAIRLDHCPTRDSALVRIARRDPECRSGAGRSACEILCGRYSMMTAHRNVFGPDDLRWMESLLESCSSAGCQAAQGCSEAEAR